MLETRIKSKYDRALAQADFSTDRARPGTGRVRLWGRPRPPSHRHEFKAGGRRPRKWYRHGKSFRPTALALAPAEKTGKTRKTWKTMKTMKTMKTRTRKTWKTKTSKQNQRKHGKPEEHRKHRKHRKHAKRSTKRDVHYGLGTHWSANATYTMVWTHMALRTQRFRISWPTTFYVHNGLVGHGCPNHCVRNLVGYVCPHCCVRTFWWSMGAETIVYVTFGFPFLGFPSFQIFPCFSGFPWFTCFQRFRCIPFVPAFIFSQLSPRSALTDAPNHTN